MWILDSEPVEPCVQLVKLYSIHTSNYILLAGPKKVHVLSLQLTSISYAAIFNFLTFLHRLLVGLGAESNSPLPA